MKAAIVCASVSHGNTRKVADVIAQALDAEIMEPERFDPGTLGDYDLVGFGSGIFGMAFHPRLSGLVDSLPSGRDGKAFVFSTSGLPEPPFRPYTRMLSNRLRYKGFDVIGTFSCRAFDTWAPFKPFGGIRKGRPDAADLAAAHDFAETLRTPFAGD